MGVVSRVPCDSRRAAARGMEHLPNPLAPRSTEDLCSSMNGTDERKRPCPSNAGRVMRDLNHDFKNLCQRNRDGSFATQHDRKSILSLIANQLDEDGFRHLRATGVRSKHVEHLVERWHAEEISAGTFENRMSALRWLAERRSTSRTSSRATTRPMASPNGAMSPTPCYAQKDKTRMNAAVQAGFEVG